MTVNHPVPQPAPRSSHSPPGSAPYQQVTDHQRAHWRTLGARRAVFGALWLVAGILITLITMSHAAVGGGFYIVAFGPVIGGAVQIVSGIRMYRRGSRD